MHPDIEVHYTLDDASDATPTWVAVSDNLVRSFNTSRGRDSELSRVDAGTATLVLDNRTRLFDPTVVGMRPMSRWRIRCDATGTKDIFLGYAESFDMQFSEGRDAITVISLVDEFKLLALDHLPVTDPPRDTYTDVVLFDEPQGYWRMQEADGLPLPFLNPAVGSVHMQAGQISRQTTPIIGDWPVDTVTGVAYGARSSTSWIRTYDTDPGVDGLPIGGPGDAAGLSAMTFELWFKSSEALPAANRRIVLGPRTDAGANAQYALDLLTNGKIRATAVNVAGTSYTADSLASISASVWYHLAITVQSTATSLYVNGVLQTPQGSFSGSFDVADSGAFLQFGTDTAVGGTRYFDEPAFYRYTVATNRLLAHYNAGVNRGYPTQNAADRLNAILDDSSSVAARSISGGTHLMTPTFTKGQATLGAMRQAEDAEGNDSVLFIASNGTITWLEGFHRVVFPWDTIQATFDDDGTDLPYLDVNIDYNESFLYNDIHVTRDGSTTITESDATSISRYGKRSLSFTGLPITADADQQELADNLLAKYKDPMIRITSLVVNTVNTTVAAAALALDIGDRIRVFRTHPNGGARIDQTLFVQKIAIEAPEGEQPWTITLGVSPL